jgi:hypothetical protein
MECDIHFSCVKEDGLWLQVHDLEMGYDIHFSFLKADVLA